MEEIEKTALKNTINKGEIEPEAIAKMLFSKKPSEVNLLVKRLSPTGKKNARAALLHEAEKRATVRGEININNFIDQLDDPKKLGQAANVLFKGKGAEQIEGLIKAIRLTNRSEIVKKAAAGGGSASGVPIVSAALLHLLGGLGPTIGAAIAAGGGSRIYESAPVRNYLMRLAKSKDPKEDRRLLERLMAALERSLVPSAIIAQKEIAAQPAPISDQVP